MTSDVPSGIARIHVPVGRGCSFQANKGEFVAVVDVGGHQCADFWAIDANDFGHYLSPPHTIVTIRSVQPRVEGVLVTNRRDHRGR